MKSVTLHKKFMQKSMPTRYMARLMAISVMARRVSMAGEIWKCSVVQSMKAEYVSTFDFFTF